MNLSGMHPDAPADDLGRRLIARGWRLATAESCTGGGLGAAITAIPGSSKWYERGFITYSNEAKQELLGVAQQDLDTHGAVSAEVAVAMARGALTHSRAQCSVAITGIAGPEGGSADKPVGTVYIAWAVPDRPIDVTRHGYHGDRQAIRARAVELAMHGLIERLT